MLRSCKLGYIFFIITVFSWENLAGSSNVNLRINNSYLVCQLHFIHTTSVPSILVIESIICTQQNDMSTLEKTKMFCNFDANQRVFSVCMVR